MPQVLVVALYKFVPFEDFESHREPLLEFCKARDIRGSLLIAKEGMNGTVAGEEKHVRDLLDHIKSDPRFADLTHKESWAERIPFRRMKVRLKKEIVNMGLPTIDPRQTVGTYVKPEDWNALISDPDVVVIDTRNDYEVAMGTFERAIDPETETFKEFPDWVKEHGELKQAKKVAMFCTGGIRCEKATALMLEEGYDEVYHLEGGILNYLEKVPEEQSLWKGECFVFDDRVSVDHALKPVWGKNVPEKTRKILADYMINDDD
ncbi:rhodanese-related sulfurtransferase [Pseudovibrio exalbescens]|uniref:oxygen-dependent tRNA uridine(34) hydroxylase TrhO n=1 Tax=Pseudovibrio exalbescens TaxID=197461 RepID=UPI002366F517|nr:rhodanese-related sulfurtransferase [Pseudovibrio exalbescens]MDD7910379.1 rhodanese-related sulfurtransferase [Pseudovibrio exalbescens]